MLLLQRFPLWCVRGVVLKLTFVFAICCGGCSGTRVDDSKVLPSQSTGRILFPNARTDKERMMVIVGSFRDANNRWPTSTQEIAQFSIETMGVERGRIPSVLHSLRLMTTGNEKLVLCTDEEEWVFKAAKSGASRGVSLFTRPKNVKRP